MRRSVQVCKLTCEAFRKAMHAELDLVELKIEHQSNFSSGRTDENYATE